MNSVRRFKVDSLIIHTHNKRVSGSVGWWSLPEPYGSEFSGLYGLPDTSG
jgi:hypothetical protein